MKRKFYAAEYWSGKSTTTGTANKTTGRYSTAASLAVFPTAAERNAWVDAGRATCDVSGNCRRALTPAEARALRAGSSGEEYQEELESLVMNYEMENN
jgi:hypothetical protein